MRFLCVAVTRSAGAICLLLATITSSLGAESDTNSLVDREFEFAAGLIKLGLNDYAEQFVNRLVMTHPEVATRADVIRAESFVARRRLKQAEEIVNKMPKDSPKAQAIMLSLADGYFQVGEYDKCSRYYRDFFSQYTNRIPDDPDLLRFYRDATHKFGQMLARENKALEAADVFDLYLKSGPSKELARQVRQEQVELWLKAVEGMSGPQRTALLARAEKNCRDVLWEGADLWFGRAIVSYAQIEILRGRKDAAAKILASDLRFLKDVDKSMKEQGIPMSESPYAGARFLLGTLYMEEADVLTGTRAQRETEALQYFERGLAEIQTVWDLIVRINKRDALIVSKKDTRTGEPPPLQGTATQRQKPFEDAAAEAKAFEDRLSQCSEKGWDPAVADRANALKEKVRALISAIAQYPKEAGVTAGPEVTIGDEFKGRAYGKHAMEFLGADSDRQQRAVELYTKSLSEFYNVFADYAGSEWNAQAGVRVSSLKDRLRALTGKEVSIEVKKGGKEKLAAVAFKEGLSLFMRKDYQKAVEQYRQALKDAPEGADSVQALGNSMEAYANLGDPLPVKVIAEYLGERFRDRPEAGQALLRIGKFYFDEKDRVMYEYLYGLYLASFPDHLSAPTILFMLGEQRWAAKDYEAAVPYYRRILARYVKSPYFVKALNKIGWCHYEAGNFTNAVVGFSAYLKESQASAEKAQAKLCLADSYRQMDDYTNAVTHYRELATWLELKDNPYSSTALELDRNRGLREQARFFEAYSVGRIAQAAPQSGVADVQTAQALYRKFLDEHPNSKLAPTALSHMGALLLTAGKPEEATKAFDELASKYPNSDQGQNVKLATIKSLLDIGMADRARQVLDEMVADAGKYPADQLTKAGQMFLDRGDSETGVKALSKVVESLKATPVPTDAAAAKQRGDLEQRALFNLGKAQFAMKRYEDAVGSLNALITRYPLSALFFEARFTLGRAYQELKKLDEAMEVMRDVFKRASDQNLINRASLELATIQVAKGDKSAALASYQRIVLLGKVDDPGTRPLYREALLASIPLFVEMGRGKDAIENCELFTVNFPNDEKTGKVLQWKGNAMLSISSGATPAAPEAAGSGAK